jgi:hypothetical protein
VGNIQAEGLGFIVDIGNTINLENQNLATQPIEITAPIDKNQTYNFVSYSVCKRRPAAERKQLNPNFTTFVINAINPPGCPVYIYDSKDQEYAFVVDGHVGIVNPERTKAGDFAFFDNPADPLRKPSKTTMQIIGCAGIPPSTTPATKTPSSLTWCCDSAAPNGVWASSFPDSDNPHHTLKFVVGSEVARQCTFADTKIGCNGLPTNRVVCSHGGFGPQPPQP